MISRDPRPFMIVVSVIALLAPIAAQASGLVSVQQSDGSTQSYQRVGMKLVGRTVFLSSPNRKDVLEIATDACSYPAGVERCLPYATTLHRGGRSHLIPMDRGAVYLNLTNDVEHLPHSSRILEPQHVLVHLHTMRGTYISADGKLDVTK
jgi:hypothetical protein